MKPYIFLALLMSVFLACETKTEFKVISEPCPETEKPSIAKLKAQLTADGFEIFDFVDPDSGDTTLMQKYFIVFLKKGTHRSQTKEAADSLQMLHMEHLGRMYGEGFADISGPFGDDSEIRGITIYNVPTLHKADSLASLDPMVQSGRLEIEVHPWWAAKGFLLR